MHELILHHFCNERHSVIRDDKEKFLFFFFHYQMRKSRPDHVTGAEETQGDEITPINLTREA